MSTLTLWSDSSRPKSSRKLAASFALGWQESLWAGKAERLGLLEFGRRYFPHYTELRPVGDDGEFVADEPGWHPSRFHQDLCREIDRVLAASGSQRLAVAAPRGNAKSTWVSLILTLYVICHELKRLTLIISNTSTLAESLLADVRHELEDNELLRSDYPAACGAGPVWREDVIVTRNTCMVRAMGAGKRVRGLRFRQHRVGLVVLDDLENDEHVRSPEQREKMWHWLHKAVLKTGGPGQKFDVVQVGTLLHVDSVAARLQDPRRAPGWRAMLYRSVIRWSDRPDLWEQWERLYTDWTRPPEERQRVAHEFFLAHKEQMLAGTEVLWPEAEPYYRLMQLRVDEGPMAFDAEKQNSPIDPSQCLFREEWFRWFSELIQPDGTVWLVPDDGDAVALSDCDVYAAVDPSLGKQSRHSDPSAIIVVAAHPKWRGGTRPEYQTYWVLDADIRRRPPHEIIQRIFQLAVLRGFKRCGVERVQFQEFFADEVIRQAQQDIKTADITFRKLFPIKDKRARIERLQPFVYSGKLRFSKQTCGTLYDQMRYYPQADHDDGPDALEMCLRVIGAIDWHLLDDDEPRVPAPASEAEGAARQVRDIVERLPDGAAVLSATCGGCRNFLDSGGEIGRCYVRRCLVRPETVACEEWEPRGDGA